MHVPTRTCPVACRQTVVAPGAHSEHLIFTSQFSVLQGRCHFRSSVPRQTTRKPYRRATLIKASSGNGAQLVPAKRAVVSEKEGPSTDFKVIWGRLWKVGSCACVAATSDSLNNTN